MEWATEPNPHGLHGTVRNPRYRCWDDRAEVDMAATFLAEGKDVPELLPTRGTIVAWSPKSRARLVARLSDLDYTRLYGGYRTCADCSTNYDARLECCPACRSSNMVSVTNTIIR
jgi:hypothetical protein